MRRYLCVKIRDAKILNIIIMNTFVLILYVILKLTVTVTNFNIDIDSFNAVIYSLEY